MKGGGDCGIEDEMKCMNIYDANGTNDNTEIKYNKICLNCLKEVDDDLRCSKCRAARYCSRSW